MKEKMKKLFSKINFKIIIEKIKNLSKAKKIAVVSIATILVLVLFIEFVVAPFYERGLFPESLVLDFQNYNVRVGDSHIVYANGIYADNTTSIIKKLKCKSSDESILSTDGNVIIGKKEGTVELECDYWWRKTKTKVTVLKVEEAFSVSPKYLSQEYKRYQSKKDEEDRVGLNVVADGNEVYINWTRVPKAKKYVLFKADKSKKFKKIYETGKNYIYRDKKATEGINYYKLIAYDKKGKELSFKQTGIKNKREKAFDEDADNDGDGLTNKEELKYGTDINKKDTDKDGINDKEAIRAFGTGLPSKIINNNELKKLKVNEKSVKEVDGKTVKGFVTADKKVVVDIKGEEAVKTGKITVTEKENTFYDSQKGLIGNVKDIKFDGNGMKEARITLSYKDEDLNGSKPENLKIYYIDEKNSKVEATKDVKVDTKNKTVSATVSHFSPYAIGDEKVFGDMTIKGSMDKTDIVFLVDNSKAIVENGGVKASKQLITKFSNYLDKLNDGITEANKARIGIVSFSETPKLVLEATADSNMLKNSIDSIVDTEGESGIGDGLAASKSSFSDDTRKKIVILLTDGYDDKGIPDSELEKLADIYGDTLTINTIAYGKEANNDTLCNMATNSGGIFYKMGIGLLEVEVEEIYQKIVKQAFLKKETAAPTQELKTIFSKEYKGYNYQEAMKLYAETNVNLVSGSFSESVDDFDIDLNTNDLTFTRTYNSSDSAQDSIIGNGWTTNYEGKLEILSKYGKTKNVTNIRLNAGKAGKILCSIVANYPLEYALDANGNVQTTKVDNIDWDKVKIGNTVYYVKKTDLEYMGGGVEVTYPTGTQLTFKEGVVNKSGVTNYITPYGSADTLIYKDSKYYLVTTDGEAYVYDSKGKFIEIRDQEGNYQTITYNTAGNVSEVKDNTGKKLVFQYGYDNKLYRIKDDLGRYVEYVRDDNGNLTGVYDTQGTKTTYTYYGWKEDFKLKEIINPKNEVVVKNEYDIFGRLIVQYEEGDACYHAYKDIYKDSEDKVIPGYDRMIRYFIDQRGIESSVEFNPVTMSVIESKDAEGNVTKQRNYIDFNDNGVFEEATEEITNVVEGDDVSNKMAEQAKIGNVQTAQDTIEKNGAVTRTVYDKYKNVKKTIDPVGEVINEYLWETEDVANYKDYMAYFRITSLKKTTGKDMGITRYEYESGTARLLKTIDPAGNVTENEYYSPSETNSICGLVKTIKEHHVNSSGTLINDFITTKYEYDSLGNRTKIIDSLGNTTREEYDVLGRLVNTIDAKGNETTCKYDSSDRLIEEVDSLGQKNITEYDDVNGIKTEIDVDGKKTQEVYDEKEQLIEVIDPDGNKTKYLYDATGNKVAEIDSSGRVNLWAYNKLGNLIAEMDAVGNVISYEYDKMGNVTKTTDPNGYEVICEYDISGRKIAEEKYYTDIEPDGKEIKKVKRAEYTYNTNNKVLSIKDCSTGLAIKKEYDILGRETKSIYGYGLLDDQGRSMAKTTTTEYDVKKEENENGVLESFDVIKTIDPLGNINYEYSNVFGMSRKTIDPMGAVDKFQYDQVGNVVKEINEKGKEKTFEYDKLSRLVKIVDYDGSTEETGYNPNSTVKWEKDSRGNVTNYEYTNLGQLKKVIDPQGRATTYEYNKTGTVNSITDTWGNKTSYEYDELNHMVAKIDPMGYKTNYTYDWAGNVLSESSANDPDVKIEYTYDEFYRPVVTKDRLGSKTYTRYDSNDNVLSFTDPLGNTTMMEYDIFGRKIKDIAPGDTSVKAGYTTYEYNDNNNIVKTEDSLGMQELYEYDKNGRLLKSTSVNKNNEDEKTEVSYEYDISGNTVAQIDANGNRTEMAYDDCGQLSTKKAIVNGKEQITELKYDSEGNLLKLKDFRGNEIEYKYDELNQKIKTIDANQKVIEEIEINPESKMIAKYDALRNKEENYYDNNGQVVKKVMPKNRIIEFKYDKEGNLIESIDAKKQTTKFAYDKMNKLTKVINANNEETKFTYDLNGNMLTQTDGNNNTTSFEYNVLGLPVKKVDPSGKIDGAYVNGKVESYTYREDGSLKSRIDRNGNNHEFKYDIFGRLIEKTAGDEKVSYKYDKNNNLIEMTDKTGTTKRKYDELNRCIEKEVPQIGKSTYTYDIIEGYTGEEEGFTGEKTIDPKGNETVKVYDRVGRLNKVIADGNTTTYGYYDNGLAKNVNRQNGLTTEYIYDEAGQLTKLENKLGSIVQETYDYEYDEGGNLTKKVDKKGTTLYTYDKLNRLMTVKDYKNKLTSYTYDKAGNRLTETVDGVQSNYSYNDQNRLIKITSKEGIKDISYEFEYDNNGNEIKETKISDNSEDVIMENVYNEWNEAIEIAVNGKAIKNTYNGDGLRVKKEVDNKTTNYLYESTNVVLETDAQNNETAKNVYGNNLISRETNNETHTYMYNGHGDVTGITDEEGTIEGSYYYDAFGVMEEDTSEVDNPFTYSGYQYDEESELYYLNARYYDPEIARFLTEDTYRGDPNDPLSLNLYTYCENDPILATDPTGHWPSFLDKAVKSAKRVVNRVKKVAKKHVKRIVKKAARTVAKVAKQAKRKVYDGANYIRKKAQTVKKVVKRAYNRSRNYIVRKAKKAVRYARSAYRATKAMAKVVTRVTAKVAKKAASYVAKKASKAYKAVKSTVKSAAKTVANAVKNKVSALAKAASNVDWTRVAMGAAAIAGGIAIAALVIATAGTAAPLAGVAISLMLGSATVTAGASAAGTILIAGAAVAAGAYATSEVIEGVQDVGYGLSGSSQASYNPMRDEFFGGDQASYDIFGGIASAPFALVGSMGIAGKSALKSSNNQVYEGEAAGGHGNVKVGSDFGGVGIKQMPQNDVQKNYNKVMADSGNGGSGSGGQKLLSSEGNVGTYKDLVKSGSRGDNITPHHMPSAEYMKENFNISKNDGVSMNMEQPFPGAGGRHRLTRSYGSGTDLTETPRDSLARDIMDVRRIYQNDGLYTSTIRQSLQEVIAMNKRLFPEIFRKSRR